MMGRTDTDRDGRTAVHQFTPLPFAAQEQHADVAQVLVDLGADIEGRNVHGATHENGELEDEGVGYLEFVTRASMATR